MAREINSRLNRLRNRRRGIDRLDRLNEMARDELLKNSVSDEAWQKRAQYQPYTRYALGGMQEVGTDYTGISLETANRVGNQLNTGLTAAGFNVAFDLQGSVPLNVHIRGVSDVDLLSLDNAFLTYEITGLRSQLGFYRSPTIQTSLGVLGSLRREAEKILINKSPAATVTTSGGKAITISGGSLARPVDVVPSHWHDTAVYQNSQLKRDRGIVILNKKVPETINNLPFLHIDRINERDASTGGGLKKAIRLCKNVKNDAVEEGRNIVFPSFDIAATMYHADMTALGHGRFYELAVLAETQRFLDELYCYPDRARALMVPDGSRRIFDTQAKLDGMKQLSVEMDDLAKEVAREQDVQLKLRTELSLADSRQALTRALIP